MKRWSGQPTNGGWLLERRVLPQHTDHAGVMWHGTYVAWLEEARVEALAQAGLAYRDLSVRGLELPVVSLAIDYRRSLLHGDAVQIWSQLMPRQGIKIQWRSWFLASDGGVAAEAIVGLVLVAGAHQPGRLRLVRRLPADLEAALAILATGLP
ncbi:MAG: acyl-CoA thioesterase [Synechococcus sp.]|nr:acyl-CoA thioesterase [Synechococcus sp.]